MSAIPMLTEEECYLVAIFDDPSGVELAEFCWIDEEKPDGIFRLWDYQWVWYRNEETFQIDWCVAAGEMVLTRRGHVPIEQVAIGDEVWTHRNRWRAVTATWDRGEKDVVRVRNPGNAVGVLLTEDHKMWAREGERRMSAGVRSVRMESPSFVAPKDFNVRSGEARATMVSSPWLFEGSVIPEVARQANCGRNTIPTVGSDLMWLAGVYVAEGSFHDSADRKMMETCLSVHESEAELIQKVAARCGLAARIVRATNPVMRTVVLPGRSLAFWLAEHFGRHAAQKRLPAWSRGLPEDERRALLDGLSFGDGHERDGGMEYTTVSKALAYDVRLLIQSLGRGANVSLKRPAGVMQIQGRTVQTQDTYSVTMWAGSRGGREVARDDHVWTAHYDALPAGRAHVYDLTVDEDHSFVVNGQVVSNCGRAVGKSVGIQMRAFAFPFNHPGAEMLITAPELNHLRPVTDKIEHLFRTTRLGSAMLPKTRGQGINHQPQFQAAFVNNARIISRLPNRDGRGVKGSVVAGTLVLTTSGHVPAEGIKVGDQVLTDAGRYMPVLHVHAYEADVVTVKGAGHRGMSVSTNHRFLARRNRTPQRARTLEAPGWVDALNEERERHYWASPMTFPELALPDPPDGLVDGVTLLQLAGAYAADGSLGGTARDGSRSQVQFADEEAGLQWVEAAARRLGYNPRRTPSDTCAKMAISSCSLTAWLDQHFGHRAEGKRMPAWLLGAPSAARMAFLEGYLRGDGHWSRKRARWELGSASKDLALGVKLLAQSLGCKTTYSWVDPKVTEICGVTLKAAAQRSHRVQITERGAGLIEHDFLWGKIGKAKEAGRRMVYDLVVAEDHSYVADGIVHKGSDWLPDGTVA